MFYAVIIKEIEHIEKILRWIRSNPKRALIIAAVIYIIGIPTIIYIEKVTNKKQESLRLENKSFEQQVQALDQVESSIKDLLLFVEDQKTRIRKSEDLVKSLKKEEKKLKPVVESKREVVNAILEAQSDKQKSERWISSVISFALGVLSSLTATFLAYLGIQKMRQRLTGIVPP